MVALRDVAVGDEFVVGATISVTSKSSDGYHATNRSIQARGVVVEVGVRREIFDGWSRRLSRTSDGVRLAVFHEDEKIAEQILQARKLKTYWADYRAEVDARLEAERKRNVRIEVEKARVGDLAERVTALVGPLQQQREGAMSRTAIKHHRDYNEPYAAVASVSLFFDRIEEFRDLVEMAELGVRLRNLDPDLLEALLAEGDD